MPVLPACSCLSCPSHAAVIESAGGRVPCGVYPSSSITDAQWRVLEPLLPAPGNTRGKGGRNEKHDRRRILDAVFYLVRGGIAWRALPKEFPPYQTVYGFFRRWAKAGLCWSSTTCCATWFACTRAGTHGRPLG
jgi:transposase